MLVARLMELVNTIRKTIDNGANGAADPAVREATETVAVMLDLIAPHTAEEMWEILGHEPSVGLVTWRSANPALLVEDTITAVAQVMREGSFGLGATRSETIRRVVIPAALPGIVGGFLLAVSRAIGETMIVVMAAGLSANLTANPFNSVTTVTTQIVQLLTGDQEFDSPKTLAAFALGLVLFLVTLVLNLIALRVVRRYREAYE